jgi:hypothetical protein
VSRSLEFVDFVLRYGQFTLRFRDIAVMPFGVFCLCDDDSSATCAPLLLSVVPL